MGTTINLSLTQKLSLLASVVLVIVLYFGCERKSPEIRGVEKSRSGQLEATGVQNLIKDARSQINSEQSLLLEELNKSLNATENEAEKAEILKKISSRWFEFGFPAIAGHYAEEVAKYLDDEESWAIAGTTYAIALNRSDDEKVKSLSFKRAVNAFEHALSINPGNISHKVNIAVCYTDFPPSDNPMQGILMLRELNDQHPENISVLNQLARLAIRTNQIDRAKERLEQALTIDPANKTSNCMMADLLASQNEDNSKYLKYCNN